MEQPVLQVNNLHYQYEKGLVLENINFHLQAGDFLGIVGENGSGKSTLLKLILQLLPLQTGEIHLFDQKLSHFSDWQKVGFVSQKANSFNSGFPATVEEVVCCGLVKKKFKLFSGKERKEKCAEALRLVDMAAFAEKNIGELSGGQQQRVFIARALINQPTILFLDEPTVGVDEARVHDFYELLKKLNVEKQITIVLVTHDMELISAYANRMLVLARTVNFFGSASGYSEIKSRRLHDIFGCIEEKV